MIREIDIKDIPPIAQPVRSKRPETAFAKAQVEAFKTSDLDAVEVIDVPTAYNTTRLYSALKNATWSEYGYPGRVRVMRRGARLFLIKQPKWAC